MTTTWLSGEQKPRTTMKRTVWADSKVLQMPGGGGRLQALWRDTEPMTCTLRLGRDGNFHVRCVLPWAKTLTRNSCCLAGTEAVHPNAELRDLQTVSAHTKDKRGLGCRK